MTVRTRFAPSPTGDLHLGGARTALYSDLYAKRMGGQFVLRIEDTDGERSTQASVEAILSGMAWLGLTPDEGPFYQSKRFDRYQAVLKEWLDTGLAYRCACSKERLIQLREKQLAAKQKPRYDGHCRHQDIPAFEPHVVRFRTPLEGCISFEDHIRGLITIENQELDDLILARSDGTPTYHFTVVVDDSDMGITHVTRGDDHINNTPRQIHLFHALKTTPPQYAHLPMILGADGQRLSKRHGAVGVMTYRDAGYLPDALLNHLVRLGWSHGDQELFSREEMIQHFSTAQVSRSPACFSLDKLQWLNQHYIKTLPTEQIMDALQWHLDDQKITVTESPDLKAIVAIQADRVKTLKEMAEQSRYFYEPIDAYDPKAEKKYLTPEAGAVLTELKTALSACDWSLESLHDVVQFLAQRLNLKLGKVAQPLRVALTGGTVSPSIDQTLFLVGRTRTMARLEAAIAHCASSE